MIMKKNFLCSVTAILITILLSACGCSDKDSSPSAENGEATDLEEELSVVIPSETKDRFSSEESQKQTSAESQPSSEALPSNNQEGSSEIGNIILPTGVQNAGKGKLRYSTSVLSLRVTFPEEFCIADNDYIPEYGIYLQNPEGNATLLLESVTDNSLSTSEMTSYLRSQYPSAKIYTTDQKDIVCKMDMLDRSGNQFYLMQRIRVKSGGYMKIVLCCKPELKDIYDRIFNEINFI